jgi:hypothetical protein
MAKEAVSKYRTIAVLATVPSTLDPTVRLLNSQARLIGRSVEIVEGLAQGAYQSLVSGDPESHDQLILETAQRVADKVEAVVLAQGSMTRMEKSLSEGIGKKVLSSPMRALHKVKSVISQ